MYRIKQYTPFSQSHWTIKQYPKYRHRNLQSPLLLFYLYFSSKEKIWRISRLLKDRDRRKFRYKILPQFRTQKIGVVGAPLVYGQPLNGTCAAPSLFRSLNLADRLASKGAIIHDYGDLQFKAMADDFAVVPGCNYAQTVGEANKQIATAVSEMIKDGQSVLVLGGDHSVGLGSVIGHASIRPDVALIWVDAHADINTPLTSPSGNLHGMVMSFLVKEFPRLSPPVPGLDWCKPCISSRNIAYIGLRSVDHGEKTFLRTLGICNFTMEDIEEFGIDFAMTNALDRIDPEGKRPIHISFDVDCLDYSLMPATGCIPAGRGMNLRDALSIARIVHNTRRLSVMDVVELNPMLVSEREAVRSAQVMVQVIARTFTGKRMRGHEPTLVYPGFELAV